MKKILITGGGGLVGSSLAYCLKNSQIADDILILKNRAQCDLSNSEAVNELFNSYRPTHVYHLAAAVYGLGGNLSFPADIFLDNILINSNVVDACRRFGVKKIVAMGTAAMYSDGLDQPMHEDDSMLGLPHNSEMAYAFSKRAMLVHLQSCRKQFGLEYAFAIATNMYGPNDKFDTVNGHVVPSLLKKFLDAEEKSNHVKVWGDGSPTRDFLFSDDAADGLMLIMDKGHGAYNLATGVSHKIYDLVSIISTHFPSVNFSWDISKPLGQMSRSYNCSRLNNLGFSAKYNLSSGILKTISWLRENSSYKIRT